MIIIGKNGTGSTGYTDGWPANLDKTLPTASFTLAVSSANAADAAAGTGARTLNVTYLDASYVTQTTTVTLNGQTKVDIATALRFVKATVATAGSGAVNAGIIYFYDSSDTVTSGVPQTNAKKFGYMVAGDNETFDTTFTVPAKHLYRIKRMTISSLDSTTTAKAHANQLKYRDNLGSGLWITRPLPSMTGGGASGQGYIEWCPKEWELGLSVFTEKMDVKIQSKQSAAGLWMSFIEIQDDLDL